MRLLKKSRRYSEKVGEVESQIKSESRRYSGKLGKVKTVSEIKPEKVRELTIVGHIRKKKLVYQLCVDEGNGTP